MRSVLRAVAIAVFAVSALAACTPRAAMPPDVHPSQSMTPTQSRTPTPTASPTSTTAAQRAADLVGRMTIREKAASVVMAQIPGTDPAALGAGLADGAGNLILMGDGITVDGESQRALLDEATAGVEPRPLIATDEEGGDVARLPWDELPSARTLKGAESAAVERAFAARGGLLAEAGISVNFGVVADVPRGEESFIYSRAFGTDPAVVAGAVAAAVRGEAGRVFTTLKHFPGHGAAEGDSHSAIPTTDETYEAWLAGDAMPFQAGIDAGASLVMTGHLRFTAVSPEPASLSPEWYGILRDSMGFDGVAVTDDIGMLTGSGEAAYADVNDDAIAALRAGADLVLFVAGSGAEQNVAMVERIAQAAEGGALPEARLDEAATRVMTLRLGLEE
ncbi:MAG TPA: glycoside hydrolase family 3 N-terminal domain-containing protein [Microbacterium sp.]|nr:glycoside hydrolase family 3 N-terminal domain-containing protein [Microbacterium sp.]